MEVNVKDEQVALHRLKKQASWYHQWLERVWIIRTRSKPRVMLRGVSLYLLGYCPGNPLVEILNAADAIVYGFGC